MINKRNAVITTVIMGCVSLSDINACCKGVPEGIKVFELLFNNLDGCTYDKLSDFFKDANGKKGIKGKDIYSKFDSALSVHGSVNTLIVSFYEDDKKALTYVKGDDTEVPNGKDCKVVKITFTDQTSGTQIGTDDETLHDVKKVTVDAKKGRKP